MKSYLLISIFLLVACNSTESSVEKADCKGQNFKVVKKNPNATVEVRGVDVYLQVINPYSEEEISLVYQETDYDPDREIHTHLFVSDIHVFQNEEGVLRDATLKDFWSYSHQSDSIILGTSIGAWGGKFIADSVTNQVTAGGLVTSGKLSLDASSTIDIGVETNVNDADFGYYIPKFAFSPNQMTRKISLGVYKAFYDRSGIGPNQVTLQSDTISMVIHNLFNTHNIGTNQTDAKYLNADFSHCISG